VKLGVALPMAGAWATPENQMRVAQTAEALGYHSVWVFQRLLYAIQPKGDYPPMPGQPWPKAFERVFDPIVSLAYVAGATRRVRLGTSVLIMPYYTPILLAKQLATLDVVSGGRLDVGLGIGWSEDEYDAVGVPFRRRGRRADEFLRCLKAIWTDDVVEFGVQQRLAAADRDDGRPQLAQLVDAAEHGVQRDWAGDIVEFVAVRAGQIAAAHGDDVGQQRVLGGNNRLGHGAQAAGFADQASHAAAEFGRGRHSFPITLMATQNAP